MTFNLFIIILSILENDFSTPHYPTSTLQQDT